MNLKHLFLGTVAWGLLAGSAFAQSAPNQILSSLPAAASTFNLTFTGSCPKNAVAVLAAFVSTNQTWGSSNLTDTAGNTWIPRTEFSQNAAHIKLYTSVLSGGAIVANTTVLNSVTKSGSTSGPVFDAECYSSGTAVDSTGGDNGATSSNTATLATSVGAVTGASQVGLFIFMSNRWNLVTLPPATSWGTGGTALSGVSFGLEDFYKNVAAASSDTATISGGLSSTTWVAAWAGITYGGAAKHCTLMTNGAGPC